MKFIKKHKMWIIAILCFIIFDILFYSPLFFPKEKLIITPEFGGGDTLAIQMPWKKELCTHIKRFQFPLWIKNMGFGWPLFAEAEVGALDPINVSTCIFFNYKTAFNLQIVFHTLFSQILLLLVGFEIGLSIYGALFLALLLPFVPFIVMNYMQISLVYPFLIGSYVFWGVLRTLKKLTLMNFFILTFSLLLLFLTNHSQIFFIITVFIYIFVFCFFVLNPRFTKIIKTLLKTYFFITTSYIASFFLGAIQFFPMVEYFFHSDRGNKVFGSFATNFDQNFGLKNLLTIFSPYLWGKPQDGTYPMHLIAQPWEGTFFIFYIPLIFLLIFFLRYRIIKNKITNSLLITFFIILLIALGSNSPLYLIHYFPPFSFFRFPSRFNFVLIFILCICSSIGLGFALRRVNDIMKKVLFTIVIIVLFIEAYVFMYQFHVLFPSDKIFQPTRIIKNIKKKKYRMFLPFYDAYIIGLQYNKKGYKDNPYYYYNRMNNLIASNINLIYDIPSFDVRIGPYLARFPFIYELVLGTKGEEEIVDDMEKIYDPIFNSYSINIFKMLGISHLISTFNIKNSNFYIEDREKIDDKTTVFLYALKEQNPQVQFYRDIKYIDIVDRLKSYLETENLSTTAFVEDKSIFNILKTKPISVSDSYSIIEENNRYVKIKTNTQKESFLVFKNTWYPGWKAYINGKESILYRANFLSMGVILPKGNNIVEFRYVPLSFYIGVIVSTISLLLLMSFFIIYLRKHRFS